MIEEDARLLEALDRLNYLGTNSPAAVLFVTREGRLVAALTDGDVRRWILKKGDLDVKVGDVANYKPRYVTDRTQYDAETYMKQAEVAALPLVGADGKIERLFFRNQKKIKKTEEALHLPVVMMAGGMGKRLLPYTSVLPKPLIPVNGIPVSERIMNGFFECGCDQFYLVLNCKKNMVKAYFSDMEHGYKIHYLDEEEALGTGGGLSLLKGIIGTTFILTNCDIIIQENFYKIYNFHKAQHNVITMICSAMQLQIPYGVVEVNEDGDLESMREKPEVPFMANTGCYLVEPQVINELEKNRVVGFPEIMQEFKERGCKIGVYPISENAWMDMGTIEELNKMEDRLRNERE